MLNVWIIASLSIFFSPNGGCENAIVKELAKAQKTVNVQAYSFTNLRVVGALCGLESRGIDVRVILDKSYLNEAPMAAHELSQSKIPVLIDAKHAIAHNKVMIIDAATVITGSYNFTNQAEHMNAENVLIIHNASVAAKYLANWQAHAAHSDPMPITTATPMPTSAPTK